MYLRIFLFLAVLTGSLLSKETIRSASELDYPPFALVKQGDVADGFSVDILKAALDRMGYDVTFYVGPWDRIRNDLKEGRIDVLPLVGRTPEREAYFDFTFPYLTMHGAIFVRKDNTDILSSKDLKDKQVIVMKGDNAEEFVRREKLSDHIITTKDYTEAFKLLASGKYDAVIAQRLIGLNIIKTIDAGNIQIVGERLDAFKQAFSFAVREGDKELLAVLNEGLSLVMTDGTFHALQEKWFAGLNPDQSPTHRYLFPLTITVLILLGVLLIVLLWQRSLTLKVEKRTAELKKSKEALRKNQEVFYTLFNNMNSGSVIYTPYNNGEDFIIRDINLKGQEISSVNHDEIIGKMVTDAFPSVRELGLFDIFREVTRTGTAQSQETSFYNDGRIAIWVENFVYRLPSGDIVAIYNDRTKERMALAQLERLNIDLERRVEDAVKKTKQQEKMLLQQSRFTAIGEMINAIAHQWRQPLNSVGLMIQDIKDAYEFKELDEKYIDEIVKNTMLQINYLSKTIDDFRTFFLPNKDKEAFAVCSIIETALVLLQSQMQFNRITVRHTCLDDFMLFGYPNELKQAVINLINNAKDAIKKSPNADEGKIEIVSGTDGDEEWITVTDNGGGIPEEIMDKIYDPYFTTKFSSQGTGIGLYMTKAIIEQSMGGKLTFSNTESGVCFEIRFQKNAST